MKKTLPIIVIFLITIFIYMFVENYKSDRVQYQKIIEVINDYGFKDAKIISKTDLYQNFKVEKEEGTTNISKEGYEFIFNGKGNILHADQLWHIDGLQITDNIKPEKAWSNEEYKEYIFEKYVPKIYNKKKVTYFSKDYKQFSFYKDNPAQIFNPYDQYRFVFDNTTNTVLLFDRIVEFEIKEEPKIGEDEAIEIARDYLNKTYDRESINVSKIELTVKEENSFFEEVFTGVENISEKGLKNSKEKISYHLAYEILFGEDFVYVDALSGDVVGGDSY